MKAANVRYVARNVAPIGAWSSFALALVALGSLLFRLLMDRPFMADRLFAVSLIVVSYLAFCPALACSLYSLAFESLKRFAVVGLVLAGLAAVAVPILLDSVIALPFAFLGVMGVVKFVRWRTEKHQTHLPQTSG